MRRHELLFSFPTVVVADPRRVTSPTHSPLHFKFGVNPTPESLTVIMNVLRFSCPRGQSAAPHGWTGSTEQLAHDLQGGLVRQMGLHDRRRWCVHRSREVQPSGRPHLARGDHLHHARDSMPMRRCHVLCLHGSSCSKWWLTLHEEDLLCIRCHANMPVCTQKQPFKRERCSLMDGHGWPCERPQ